MNRASDKAMVTRSLKCTDVLETTGLAGDVQHNDTVCIRGRTGLWVGIKDPERGPVTFVHVFRLRVLLRI